MIILSWLFGIFRGQVLGPPMGDIGCQVKFVLKILIQLQLNCGLGEPKKKCKNKTVQVVKSAQKY